ncbi:cytochrome c oxidase assembly factor 4 homolog, mitochondrial [Heterodontus francisci]|uniref:cytochrome c oxidase assembly factor 4 homolog, mitochondrial n=1 Tax=Heterodontus francisci TaxID=7792 RepID=UPI00355B3BD9
MRGRLFRRDRGLSHVRGILGAAARHCGPGVAFTAVSERHRDRREGEHPALPFLHLIFQGKVGISKMSAPASQGHNWSRKSEEKDEEDPVDQMISRTGCASFHHAVQDCMAEHQDWRKCQQPVLDFKQCMAEYQQLRATPPARHKPGPAGS